MTTHDNERTEKPSARARKPYEAPAVVDRAEFETLALSCGKIGAECTYEPGGPQNS